eukprot:3834851-Rhodomonas_salina.2
MARMESERVCARPFEQRVAARLAPSRSLARSPFVSLYHLTRPLTRDVSAVTDALCLQHACGIKLPHFSQNKCNKGSRRTGMSTAGTLTCKDRLWRRTWRCRRREIPSLPIDEAVGRGRRFGRRNQSGVAFGSGQWKAFRVLKDRIKIYQQSDAQLWKVRAKR